MKRLLFVITAILVFASLGFAQERIGEVNRGIFYQEGVASWYGGEFNGRPTASGEIFNDSQLTAAHPILPFGTMLKVTNQHNNKSVTVRVNDRGPFVAARIIDLSRAAAQQLDMVSTGTAPVIVESLHEVSLPARPNQTAAIQPVTTTLPPAQTMSTEPYRELSIQPGESIQVRSASVEPYSTMNGSNPSIQNMAASNTARFQPAIPETFTGKQYRVQVGAYKQPQHAVEAFEKLKNAGLNPAYERHGDYYRVVLSGLKQDELRTLSERLGTAGFKEVLLREEL